MVILLGPFLSVPMPSGARGAAPAEGSHAAGPWAPKLGGSKEKRTTQRARLQFPQAFLHPEDFEEHCVGPKRGLVPLMVMHRRWPFFSTPTPTWDCHEDLYISLELWV